jgi:large subunit ribosomal protein L4
MESKVYNQEGKEKRIIKLPEKLFGVKWNEALVHQVVTSMMGNARIPWAHTKTRGEVRGTGKKPWRQKGTGRARHGSRRSPIWVGGGVAHGPRKNRDYSRKINKSMRAKALFTILSKKFQDGEVIFVDSIVLAEPKTKLAKEILNNFNKTAGFKGIANRKNAAYLAFDSKNENNIKGFKNFNNIETGRVKDLNPMDVLGYKYLVITNPEKSFGILSARIK